ncbi:RES family NAD+ phosphorylase [Arsukibacterium ikkense]|nr:RES family NAD+ phosphorylase [Arsukibacterium ikkense]
MTYVDMPDSAWVRNAADDIYGRYFLYDIEPHWQQDSIMRDLYRYAKPWVTDLSGLSTDRLVNELIDLFQRGELRAWRLTDGWAKPPEHTGPYVMAGSTPAAGGSVSAAPSTTSNASKPKGGSTTAVQPVAAKAAVHEAQNTSTGEPKIISGTGANVKMDAHKIYDSAFDPLSTNPTAQYRFSDPSFRNTGNDVYFGENVTTSYFEVRKNISGKSLFVGGVEIDGILDLTDQEVAKSMNVDLAKLNQKVDNPVQQKKVYAYTNQVANQAYNAGYKGILYNSTRKEGSNKAVVLFGGRFDKAKITPIINKPIK